MAVAWCVIDTEGSNGVKAASGTNMIWGRKIWASLLALCCGCLSGQAATHLSDSVDLADVSAAILKAVDGDTVIIPAGTATWSSGILLTKAVTIRGAGTNSTHINMSGGYMFKVNLVNDLPVRFTGIHFNKGAFSGAEQGAIVFDGRPIHNFRIDHCLFQFGSRTVYARTRAYGVVDHCTFFDSDSEVNPFNAVSTDLIPGENEWTLGRRISTTNTVVVEDCVMIRGSAVTANPNEVLYGQNAARCAFRFNTIIQTNSTRPLAAIDAHGSDPYRGTVLYEIHNNTFVCRNTYRFCNLRGGTMICFSNVFRQLDAGTPTVFQLKNEGLSTRGVYKALDELNNCFFWSNTLNGRLVTTVSIEPGSEPYVTEGIHYWMRAPGVGDLIHPYMPLTYPHPRVAFEDGLGSTNPPVITSSLTAGGMQGQAFGYHIDAVNSPTSFGATGLPSALVVDTNTGVISGIPQASGTFVCTISASNPYGSGSASLRIVIDPPAPRIAVSPGSLTFPEIGTGQSVDLQFFVTNVGVGTLSGTASATAPFAVVGGANYALSSGQVWPVTVRYTPVNMGAHNGRVIFTGAAGSTNTIAGQAFPVLGWTFSASSGLVSPPFTISGGYLVQNIETDGDPTTSGAGRAVYGFVITNGGNYVVSAYVDAPHTGADSFHVNVDAEPVHPMMIWDITLTAGFERRTVSWRGGGGTGVPQVFNLSPGVHKLVVRGREPGTRMDRVEITSSGTSPRPAIPDEFRFATGE
jgi:putative Ig domain-containing protein